MNGNTQQAIITAKDLRVRYNDITVLDGASLTINAADRIGMVGRNGSGKSTFLKILAGGQQPDAGEVTRRSGLLVSYLPQEFALETGKTVFENIRAGAKHVLALIAEFEALPGDSPRHVELEERIVALDGWNLDTRIHAAMSHLNVPDGDLAVDTLSGGEKRRVALCRAIVSQPDLLLLDEPTNHLDNESIDWVGEFLRNYSGAFVMVTHDRWFLDRITSSIVELANGVCYSYTGNYSTYLEAKADRQAMEDALESKRQSFLRRELDWVRRGPKARTTKAKSRLDRFHEAAAREAPELELEVDLVIPPPPPLGNRVLETRNLGMEIGGKMLFQGLDFSFEAGMRIGVVGRNGVGKTTLLRTFLGELQPTAGTIKAGKTTEFNYIDQGRLILNEEKTVLEEVSDGTEFVMFGAKQLSLRGYLKRFLFPDERMACAVKYLSGGERSRLLLARILKRGGNFIILDEPTNDLDLPTLRVLEEALIAFPGCVVVVSHDRYFLDRVCNGILAFEGNGVVSYSVGNYDYYLEKKNRYSAASSKKRLGSKGKKTHSLKETKPHRLTYKEMMELEGMEDRILSKEEEMRHLESLFSAPDFHEKHAPRTRELMEELENLKTELANLYERWQELEAVKAESK